MLFRLTPIFRGAHNGEGLLLVVRIRSASIELLYGGPAINAWKVAREPNHRGIKTISLNTLKKLHSELNPSLRIQKAL